MKKFLISTFTASFLLSTILLSQVSPKEKGLQAITADAIKGQLEFLSSDWMEGRATSEKGSYLAADYIASMFRVFGAAPTGGSDYTAFTENKIPVIAWMAAMHPDYHQPSDEVSLVNWNKMLDIIKLGYLQVWEAANGEIK